MDLLSVKGLTKVFGRKKVLDDVDFSIKEGEIVALVGRSGSGKSVFIKNLIGFYSPSSGVISFADGKIGFSMQENSLYSLLTVRQNLNYFSTLVGLKREFRASRIKDLLGFLELDDYENVLVKNLSGGTKKRVDIACALLGDPKVLIFDEPFLGLDPLLVKSLSKIFLSLSKSGKAVLVSSHILEELSEICSRVVLMKDGKLSKITKSEMGKVY